MFGCCSLITEKVIISLNQCFSTSGSWPKGGSAGLRLELVGSLTTLMFTCVNVLLFFCDLMFMRRIIHCLWYYYFLYYIIICVVVHSWFNYPLKGKKIGMGTQFICCWCWCIVWELPKYYWIRRGVYLHSVW